MQRNHYEILGIAADAGGQDIRRAYRELAKMYHPDRHISAPEPVRDRMQASMARLNEAYEVLSDAASRQRYDESLVSRLRQTNRVREPAKPTRRRRGDECEFCGSHPSTFVIIKQYTGLVLTRRVRIVEGMLCRPCGLEVFRAMTSRTLVTGWWGVIAFFANGLGVLGNVDCWNDLRRLPPPRRRRDARILTPFAVPLPSGKPLWLRPGFVTFCLALLAAGLSGGAG